MGVLCELTGHVVVDDCLDSFDIKTTRCEICSEQVIDLTRLEIVQSVQSLVCQLGYSSKVWIGTYLLLGEITV
jgi:uncharacterized protein with PIN domain